VTIPPDDDVEIWDVSAVIDQGNDFDIEAPTLVEVRRICPGCGGDRIALEETDQPPSSHAQAWRCGPLVNGRPSYPEGACRGNQTWYWCRASIEYGHRGTLIIISKPDEGGMIVMFFPDRRITPRPVAIERRGLPPGRPR